MKSEMLTTKSKNQIVTALTITNTGKYNYKKEMPVKLLLREEREI